VPGAGVEILGQGRLDRCDSAAGGDGAEAKKGERGQALKGAQGALEPLDGTPVVEGHGCRLYDYLIASESTAWKIDTFRRAIGETVHEEVEVEIVARELIGKKARARLKTEEYNDKLNNKVDAWLEPAKPASKPAAPAQEENDNEPF